LLVEDKQICNSETSGRIGETSSLERSIKSSKKLKINLVPYMTDVVNEIIDLSIKLKYSQIKLSEVSRIPSSTIALLEIGKHSPSFKSMNAISKLLGSTLLISTRGRRKYLL